MVLPDGSPRLFLSSRDGQAGAVFETDANGSPRLALFDRNGKSIAWLGELADGSRTLLLMDRGERAMATLGVGPAGALQLTLTDRQSEQRAVLGVGADGAPHLDLTGKNGKGGAGLAVTASGAPVLDLLDQDGKAGAVLAAAAGSAGLTLRDRAGKDIAGLTTDAGRWPRLFLSGDGEKVAALLTVSEDGEPGLALFDGKGKPRAVFGQTSLAGTKAVGRARRPVPYSLLFVDAAGKVTYRAPQ